MSYTSGSHTVFSDPGAQCLCNRIRPFHCRQMAAVLHNLEIGSGDSVRDRQGLRQELLPRAVTKFRA
jgi:hypothetical protein